jgi:uncharacterized protein (DUF58 family)
MTVSSASPSPVRRIRPVPGKPARRRKATGRLTAPGPRFAITRAGWAVLAVAIFVGVAAVKSRAPMLYLLFGAMIAALQVSATMAVRMLRPMEVRRKAPPRAWQNQTVPIAYFLRNLRRRSAVALTVREQPSSKGASGLELANGYCAHLPAMVVFRAGARLVASVRGRFHLGPIVVSTLFPFGLVEGRRVFRQQATLVIWPSRGRLKRQLLHRGAVETSSAAPSRGAGGQDEFFGLRDYRSDDNPRWIHWRRSAGKVSPVVREMARPLPEILFLLIDTRLEAVPADHASDLAARRERLEHVLRFAATLIDEAFNRGYQVGLALSGGKGPGVWSVGGSAAHRAALLDALADVDVNESFGLDQTVAALRPGQLRQAQVIMVTLADDAAASLNLHAIRGSCRHLLVLGESQLGAVFEDAPPPQPAKEDA